MLRKLSLSSVALLVIFLIMTIVANNIKWQPKFWKEIIISDAKGYYAYLPAVFIYHDLNFSFFDKIEKEKYFDKNHYYDYRSSFNGQTINKYYCGTAVAQIPFFLAAHELSKVFGYELDGYSRLYMTFMSLASLFYLGISLIYLRKLLKSYQIREGNITLTLFTAVFGTNLFYYSVVEPGMSHLFSFCFITIFFYYSKRYFTENRSSDLTRMGFLLGMILLIRPINVLCLLCLPFLAESFQNLITGLKKCLKFKIATFLGILFCFLLISIQLIIYKISTGSYLVYSYAQEGFNLFNPHFFDILFSYKKGLFLYTPVYLFSLAGGYHLWKSNRFGFFSWFGAFVLLTYFFSCWWMWYYGGSFSSRVYVDFISFFMILLAIMLNQTEKKRVRNAYITGIILLIIVCQIQTLQYRYMIIHWEDMTKEKYWDVFLRIDKIGK